MKKNMVVLAFCTLISTGGFQTTSFASESIPDEVLIPARVTCQSVFPELTNKLEIWNDNYKINSQLGLLMDQARYQEVVKCLDSAKIMDNLYPDILKLSKTLMDSLAHLQTTYPHMKEQVTMLMGIEDQMKAITNNFAKFIFHGQTGL